MALILENGEDRRNHREVLISLLKLSSGTFRITSPYVTDTELVRAADGREIQLLCTLHLHDVVSSATSINVLKWMLENNVDCRTLPPAMRLHAKTYIFGSGAAVISSANLTVSAFATNIEAGIDVPRAEIPGLVCWFDALWEKAEPVTLQRLAAVHDQAKKLKAAFLALKRQMQKQGEHSEREERKSSKKGDQSPLHAIFESANQFFVCNTNRRYDRRMETGGFQWEQEMFSRGLAAVWEDFKYPDHMERVDEGDVVMMFAKRVGIIRIGVALGPCKIVPADAPDRVRDFDEGKNTPEWRVPVRWIAWCDEDSAFGWKSGNYSFADVSEEQHSAMREDVLRHFVRYGVTGL